MKIVVFGPQRRLGAWQDDRVIDLNRAFAGYLREQHSDAQAQEHAEARVPPQLEAFIALGTAGLEDAGHALEYVANSGLDAVVVHDTKQVKFHAPWPGRRIACGGRKLRRPPGRHVGGPARRHQRHRPDHTHGEGRRPMGLLEST